MGPHLKEPAKSPSSRFLQTVSCCMSRSYAPSYAPLACGMAFLSREEQNRRRRQKKLPIARTNSILGVCPSTLSSGDARVRGVSTIVAVCAWSSPEGEWAATGQHSVPLWDFGCA